LADWPILASRRRFWQHVLDEVDRSGRAINLRGQLAITLDAVKRYGDRPLGVAVAGDFLFDTFAAEALSRNLISQEIYDRIELLRAQPNDGSLKARILILVYLIARIAGDAQNHGVYAKPDILGDLLIEDLGDAASVRAKIPNLLAELQDEGAVIEVNGEWRLQTKESAEWQAAFNRAQAQAASDPYLVPRHRSALLQLAIDDALAAVGNIQQGISKTTRRIERVVGDGKPAGEGLLVRLWNGWDHPLATTLNDIRAADVSKDATIHMIIAEHRREELRNAIAAREAATATIQTQGVPSTDGGKEAKAAMESRLKHEEETAKTILREAVDKAQVLVAGGAEVGSDLTRADAIRDAGNQVLDRLYPEFGAADHAGWDRVVAQARKRVPDALKEVGHTGDAQDHSVCKAFLRFLKPAKRGSELRTWFAGPPYGWPREAVDAATLVLANAGQIKVAGADGKPAVAVDLNAAQLGTCTFAPETRVISASERIAVRAVGLALGLSVPSGEETNYLLTIVDRVAQMAEAAGGDAPAPKPPEVPGMAKFLASIGNDLLAELAARHDELKPLIAQWQTEKTKKEARLRSWALAMRLVALGAREQQGALDAIRTARALLSEPDPLPSVVSAAADNLRNLTNAAYNAWQQAWHTGEARLKADAAWNKISPEKKHELRVEHALLQQDIPDLSTPEKIAESLTARGLAGWRDMAAALPTRIETALRDAAVEVEPKTQTVAMPRRVIRSKPDLDTWLDEIRATIAPLLARGPVWPAA
jgi:hypothetical protein